MKSIMPKLKKHPPADLRGKAEWLAWIMQTVGMLLVHIVLTGLLLFGAYALITISLAADFWLMTALAIIVTGLSIMGIAAVVIDVCNLVFLISETRR